MSKENSLCKQNIRYCVSVAKCIRATEAVRRRLVTRQLEAVTRRKPVVEGCQARGLLVPSPDMGYVTLPVTHAPTNVDMRLSPRPIRW